MNSEYRNTALGRGIQLIGIGKHGSKDLPEALIDEILHELDSEKANLVQLGTFFGALVTKGVAPSERTLEAFLGAGALGSPAQLYQRLCAQVPESMRAIGVKILSRATLDVYEAEQLGHYLWSEAPDPVYCGMAASVLRIRYETDAEYQGLIRAAEAAYAPSFQTTGLPARVPNTVVQLAEPFDGAEHSYLITPLLAHFLQVEGYRAVCTMGRSGGPKLALNLLDLYQTLPSAFLTSPEQLNQTSPPYGWALAQSHLAPGLDRWVERRRQMLKRPFLATMEKVLNPCGASILITSVFHITYLEKMIALADMTGFTGVIVLKRGLEGTLAPSLARASSILCGARQPDGSWQTQTFDADTAELAPFRAAQDVVVEPLSKETNLSLIQQFIERGQTGNADFDGRVNLAKALYRQGLAWIRARSHPS